VRRAGDKPKHVCALPAPTTTGDLWRCDHRRCERLWQVRPACDYCDAYGQAQHYEGQCKVGVVWRDPPLHVKVLALAGYF
jgi:hypothetical protein